MGPAECAVASVDPQVGCLLAAADVGDVGRRAGTQAGPVVGLAVIGDAGEELFIALDQGLAAHACGGGVQRQVKAGELGRARDAHRIAQTRDRELARVIEQAHDAGVLRLLQAQRGRVALGRIDVQEFAQRLDQRWRVRAHGGHEGIALDRTRLARLAAVDLHALDVLAAARERLNVVVVEEGGAARFAALGQLLREHAGVAGFIAGGVGAPIDAAEASQRGLDVQHTLTIENAAVDAVVLHDLRGRDAVVKVLLVREEVQDAAFEPVVFDVGLGNDFLQCGVAVAAQLHQLLDIALEGGGRALGQERQAPNPLGRLQARAKQQR